MSIEAVISDRSLETPSDVARLWEQEWELQDVEYCLQIISERVTAVRMAAFRSYVIDGNSGEETARKFDISVGHVYVLRHQIMAMLRQEMRRLDASRGESS